MLQANSNNFEIVFEPLPGTSQELALDSRCDITLFEGARGPGKRVSDDTLVLTNKGWLQAKDVWQGYHKLVSSDGSYTHILGIYPGYSEKLYRFTFDDGSTVDCCKDHQWSVGDSANFYRDGLKVKTTKQLLKMTGRFGVPFLSAPADGAPWTGLDPYVIGLMLGDGTMGSKNVTLYSCDDEIIEYMQREHHWYVYDYDYATTRRASCPEPMGQRYRAIMPRVKAGEKSVPLELMIAEPAARLACLQGLMDSDGSVEKEGNKCRFVSLSEQLANDVAQLVRSLGGKANCYWEYRFSPNGGNHYRWRVNFNCRNMFNPFRLTRKAERMVPTKRVPLLKYIEKIEEIPGGPARCFAVDHPSHPFIFRSAR